MILTRVYVRGRRAWTPRVWPIMLTGTTVAWAVATLLHPTIPVACAIGAGTGLAAGLGRWEIWRHRHPIITPDQFITDLRRAAPWN